MHYIYIYIYIRGDDSIRFLNDFHMMIGAIHIYYVDYDIGGRIERLHKNVIN